MVSVRAQQAAAAATAGGGGGITQRGQTPHSPLQQQQQQQGTMSTNSMGNASTPGVGGGVGVGVGNSGNPMLNTPPDQTLGFSFETRKKWKYIVFIGTQTNQHFYVLFSSHTADFFTSSATR